MTTIYSIRLMCEKDIAAMLEIYRHYVLTTAISFEYDTPAYEDYLGRIKLISAKYPCLVCEVDGVVQGFAYATDFRQRTAYQWSCESTIYIAPGQRGNGYGTRLYTALLELLSALNYANVFAGVALPNEASERLYEKVGFEATGVFRDIGYKFGAWHSTRWYQLYRPREIINIEPPRAMRDFIAEGGKDKIGALISRFNERPSNT